MPFGLRVIALLVGIVRQQVSGESEIISELPETEVPLETDREAYGDMWLRRVKEDGARGTDEGAGRRGSSVGVSDSDEGE